MDELKIQNQSSVDLPGKRSKVSKQRFDVEKVAKKKDFSGKIQQNRPRFSIARKDLHTLRNLLVDLTDRTRNQKRDGSILSQPSLKTTFSKIEQTLYPGRLSGPSDQLAQRIRAFVLNSGIYFEKRLESAIRHLESKRGPMDSETMAKHPVIRALMSTDLKPNLLVLNKLLDSAISGSPKGGRTLIDTMKNLVHRTLTNIGDQQIFASEKPSDPDLLQVFFHHLLFEELDKDAQLKIYYQNKRRRDATKQPRLSVLLEMAQLGGVRTDFWMAGSSLNITFFVETEWAKNQINKKRRDLEKKLVEKFDTVTVNAVINRKKIELFEREDLVFSNEKLINLKI